MPSYLKALALKNYRGIGPERQFMAPFKEFNLFIGANNTGKSTVLSFISKWLPVRLPQQSSGPATALGPAEAYLHGSAGQPEIALGMPIDDFVQAAVSAIHEGSKERYKEFIKTIADAVSIKSHVWIYSTLPYKGPFEMLVGANVDLPAILSHGTWNALWGAMTRRSGGSLQQNWIPETIGALTQVATYGLPKPILIPAIRQVGPKGENFEEFGGKGLIDRLAEMQSPDIDKRDERTLFDRINVFLQDVTGYDSAFIEIPHNREHILVHIDGKVLPLWSLGTGIQEVILIASYCTMNNERMVCMEEPELHLHPVLQRKLLSYLRENTNNQYFIATHSAAFIDTPGAAIFHVRSENGQTVVEESILRSSRYAICQDLGHKASDIVQSNFVVWCEGPSDRIYLNHWIQAINSSLVEGIHYSIMFYGGRNLSHLTNDDDEVTEFISLKALNRNSAVLIDSDRGSEADEINATKMRIVSEFERDGAIGWVTAGREIENYIEFSVLQAAIRLVHSRSYDKPATRGSQFDHALSYRARTDEGAKSKMMTGDKVKVAKVVCESPANLEILDLRERMTRLVEMIERANS